MFRLSLLQKFSDFMKSVMSHPDDWKKIYDSK